MRKINYWVMTISGLAAGLPGYALTWEKTSLDLAMDTGVSEITAEFPFKNEGETPVTLTELRSNCGCAQPTVKSKVVPPGGSDVVKVVYAAGDRVGPQSAQLVVRTDEKDVSPALLSLRINIRTAVSLTPRLVRWSKAEGVVPRTIEIKQLGEKPVRILEVKPLGAAVSVELKPGSEAGTWLLTLTPKSTESPSTTKVEIHTEVGVRKTTYGVFGVVR